MSSKHFILIPVEGPVVALEVEEGKDGYVFLQEALEGGHPEPVFLSGLGHVLHYEEEAEIDGMPVNPRASRLAHDDHHHGPIHGDVLVTAMPVRHVVLDPERGVTRIVTEQYPSVRDSFWEALNAEVITGSSHLPRERTWG